MNTNFPLLITDAAYAIFFVLTTVFGLWVYLKGSRKTSHVMFLLLCLAVGIYQISHAFGINVGDSDASRIIFNLTLSALFIGCFTVHWIAAVIEREREYAATVIGTYAVSIALAVFYLLKPSYYLLPSAPKLYFPNYYVPGDYFWLVIVFFIAVFFAVTRMLFKAYRRGDATHRNRLAYYIGSILIGYPLGALGFFLVYGIPLDPIFSVPFNFFIVPLAYGALRYDILDIRIAARKTISYAFFVVITAVFVFATNVGNNFIARAYPFVPNWLIPLVSSLVMVLFAGYVWERVKDLETLKYEFITVVTHKFRTPLTRIKWSSEILRRTCGSSDDEKMAISEIENANEHLASLTDMLLNLRRANDSAFQYDFERADLRLAIDGAIRNMNKRIKDRNLDFSVTCPEKEVFAVIDKRRMLFALQIVIDNAVSYTPKGGKVTVEVSKEGGSAYIRVKDNGIGIAKEDLSRMFNKFWRSKEAKEADTEGMGIGLFMAREIIDRHDGEIYAESPGIGQGSTFTIRIPLATSE